MIAAWAMEVWSNKCEETLFVSIEFKSICHKLINNLFLSQEHFVIVLLTTVLPPLVYTATASVF